MVKITNLITNKSYIGQSTNVQKRLREHFNWRDKKSYIAKSIKKYGKDNFLVELLHENIDLNILDDLEIQCIKNFNTLYPNGYNFHGGGQANRIVSEVTRKKNVY